MRRDILRLAFAFALGAGLTFGVGASAQQLELLKAGELSAATEGTFPPFSMTDAGGKLDGLEIRAFTPDGLMFEDDARKAHANSFHEEWKRYEFGLAIGELEGTGHGRGLFRG